MPLWKPKRSLLCSDRKLALLPLLSSFESERARITAPRGSSGWVSAGLHWGSWQENPTGGRYRLLVCQFSFLLKDPGGSVFVSILIASIKVSHIGMSIQHFPIYTVFDLSKKRPLRMTLLNLDSPFSLLRFQELELLIKNLSVGNKTIDLSAFCWTIKP